MEESSAGWQSPFYFNSKELDEETGLYYYGARYLNPTEERWLSVDPMFEKYVGMSPYNYCAGNPVKLVDVDGMFDEVSADIFWKKNYWDSKDVYQAKIERRGRGDYQVRVSLNNTDDMIYYHGDNDELNVDLPEVSIVGTSKNPGQSFWDKSLDKYCSFMERADVAAGEVAGRIIRHVGYADAYSGYFSFSIGLGYGINMSVEEVWMKEKGTFTTYSWGHGWEYDCSFSVGVKSSIYTGKTPMSINSFEGEGSSFSLGYKKIEVGYSLSKDKNWSSVNIGYSNGPLDYYTGSFTHSYTKTIFK